MLLLHFFHVFFVLYYFKTGPHWPNQKHDFNNSYLFIYSNWLSRLLDTSFFLTHDSAACKNVHCWDTSPVLQISWWKHKQWLRSTVTYIWRYFVWHYCLIQILELFCFLQISKLTEWKNHFQNIITQKRILKSYFVFNISAPFPFWIIFTMKAQLNYIF